MLVQKAVWMSNRNIICVASTKWHGYPCFFPGAHKKSRLFCRITNQSSNWIYSQHCRAVWYKNRGFASYIYRSRLNIVCLPGYHRMTKIGTLVLVRLGYCFMIIKQSLSSSHWSHHTVNPIINYLMDWVTKIWLQVLGWNLNCSHSIWGGTWTASLVWVEWSLLTSNESSGA